MVSRTKKLVLMAMGLLAVAVGCGSPSGAIIHALEPWYRERPEQEAVLQGRIERQDRTVGPMVRGGLAYRLVTSESRLPIYVGNDAQKLAAYDGKDVVIHGKTVSLEGEGREVELWVGRIRLAMD